MIFTADIVFPVSAPPVRDGYLECAADGTVVGFGHASDLSPERAASATRVEGFLVPGFTNAHCHIELSHMKGLFREATGMDGFIQQINELRLTIDRDGRQAAMREAFDGLVEQGVRAMGDISNCNESFSMKAEALAAGKMYTRTFLEVFGTEPEDAQAVMDGALALQREARELGLDAAPTPHSCYTMSPLLNRLSAAAGLENGYISYHSQESPEEEDMLRYGTGPLAEDYRSRGTTQLPVTGTSALIYFLDNLRKAVDFPVEGNVLLVHNTATDQESIDAAKTALKHVYWAVCPLSNIFIHRMLPPLALMRRNGLDICLGTDSLSSNHLLSMVAEMLCIQENFPEIPFEEVLRWATLNGARAIGCDGFCGSFEPGKKPGVVHIGNVDSSAVRLTAESFSKRLI